ncbi:MAG: sulfite exporter TauE/SafE family protein [Legionella sp.]|nr:MAG: sulfite exporter TauE/SafE family protein [Legionella sp.]
MIMADMLLHGAIYAFIGAFAGLMSGILGIGGGVVVVPGLVFLFQHSHIIPEDAIMHVAAGTSLAVMIITSQSSLRAHLKLGEVLWPVFKKLWLGIALGTIAGALLATLLSTYWLKIIFACFLFLIALKMLTDMHVAHPERFPPNWVNRLVSFLIGLKSGLLGVGGGVLIIPYLTYCGIEVRKIAPVSNLCTFTVAVVGTIAFTLTGFQEMRSVPFALGYVYWPAVLWVAIPSSLIAPWGAKLNYKLPIKQLKYGFIVILILTATKMLF